MNYSFKHLILAGLSLLAGTLAYAQVTTSSMNGRVTDEKGQPALGAAVVATHEPSGTTYGAVVNENGQYNIVGMRAGGPYKIEVSSVGYNSVIYKDVTLQLADALKLDAVLKESTEFLEEVVVIGTAKSKFSSEKTGAATNISNAQLSSLPTVSRDITDVTRLSPYGGSGMSFAGADGRTANFTVDGANFNNNFGLSDNLPGGGSPISIDAIEELQVVISPYDVRQTNFIGGGVNAITKSGTNTFKGTAYAYHRNENMRGDTVLGETVSGAREKDRKTTYGFTFGGPIVKNKLFFFTNFEYSKIPTVVNRWRGGDGVADADAYISRTKIEDLATVSQHVKNNYGYDTGSWTDFPADESNMKMLARIDWNITDKHHLALRYNYTLNKVWNSPNGSSMDGGVRAAYSRMSQYGMSYANSMYSMDNIVHTASLDLNSRLTDNLSNQFLATYSKLDDVRGTSSSDFPFIDIRNDDGSAPLPYIALGLELFTWNNAVHNTHINIKDDLTWYAGNHKVTGGINYEYQMADNSYMRNGSGYYRYNSLDDFINQRAPEVVCLTYGYDGEQNPAARVQFHKLGVYAQDDWQATENLKLTYGLRLDGLFFDNSDLMTNKKIYDLDYGGRHIDTGLWPSSKISVSPRIGFVWDVFGNRSLKLRGGTGLFSGRLPLVFFTNMPTNSGMVQYQAKINGTGKNGGTKTDMNLFAGPIKNRTELINFLTNELGYPKTIKPEQGTLPSEISAVDPKFKMPQVWKTSLAFDYNFPTTFPFSVSVEGIYNKTINGVCMGDWSFLPYEGFSRFNGADNRPIFQNFRRTYINEKGEVANMPNAYVLQNTNKGYGYSASVTVNMEPTEGLHLMAAYTHTASKELTGMPGSNASSVLNYMGTVNGAMYPSLHNSEYVTPDRLIADVTYSDKSGNHFSIVYEAWRGGANYSYMTSNDMNGDGYNYDLIYIPTDEQIKTGQFRFINDEHAKNFMAYANKCPYLSKNRGKYAETYSLYSPWVHRVDFSYKHDFKVKIGNSVNKLQLSFDLKNALNIFNSRYGVAKYLNPDLGSGRILKYEGVDAEGYPTFSTQKGYDGKTPMWTYSHAIGQCWYASVGIKYFFN